MAPNGDPLRLAGAIHVSCSTVSPSISRALAEEGGRRAKASGFAGFWSVFAGFLSGLLNGFEWFLSGV